MTNSVPAALAAVLPDLRCPFCRAGLALDGGLRVVACDAGGHRFDVARQGYLNLLAGRRGAAVGDDAAMVAARQAFLDAGHYAPLTAALVESALAEPGLADGARAALPQLVVDVGAGTGHHLAAVLDSCPPGTGLAIDASTQALRRAARAHPRAAALGADVWAGLPVRDGAADVVLDVFAPRNGPEFARVLAARGRLVVAVPDPAHLTELADAVGLIGVDAQKDRRLGEQLGGAFDVVARRLVTWRMGLSRQEAATLVAMTPSARHVGPQAVAERLAGLPEPVVVGAAVRVAVFRVRPRL